MPSLLITDDHPLYIDGLAGALQRCCADLVVFTANTVEDSKRCLLAHPEIDLMLLDRTLRGTDGLQHIPDFLELIPSLRIAVISAWESEVYITEVLNAGAVGFIPKSFDAPAIATAVKQLLEIGVYVHQDSLNDSLTESFTPQQHNVLQLMGYGHTNKVIARELGVGEGTVKQYVHTICKKLGAKNRTHAVQIARMRGLIC